MAFQKHGSMWNTLLSIMLIVLGSLLLLDTLGIIRDGSELFLALIFGMGAFIGASFYLQNRQHWWVLIPSGALLGVAGIFVVNSFRFLDRHVDEGSFVPLALGLAFWTIFATERKQRWAIIPAIILTSVGIMINLPRPEIFIGAMFGLGALFGFRYYFSHRQQWWIVFPSSALAGVSGVLIVDSVRILNRWLEPGGMMLFGLALGFWVLYITQPKQWWAAIPAGILTTIGFVVITSSYTNDGFIPILLFTGFGMTFGMLWLRREIDGTHWAVWPMLGLTGIGVIGSLAEYGEEWWPLIFILAGIGLLGRNFIANQRLRTAPNGSVPHTPEPEPFETEVEEHFV